MQNGVSEQQVEANFLASDEFFQLHGSNSSWVTATYQQVLGLPPSPNSLAFMALNIAFQSGAPRLALSQSMVNSTEGHVRLVNDAYQLLLGRSPDPTGQSAFVAALDQGMGPDQMLGLIASSQEYANRAASGATSGGGAGTGPFFNDPFCSDPNQFSALPGGSGGSGGNGSGGTSTGSGATSGGGSGGGSGGSGGGSGGSGGSSG
jgi:hypothetical protein